MIAESRRQGEIISVTRSERLSSSRFVLPAPSLRPCALRGVGRVRGEAYEECVSKHVVNQRIQLEGGTFVFLRLTG